MTAELVAGVLVARPDRLRGARRRRLRRRLLGPDRRRGRSAGARVRGLVKRSMGPVWEANHVWLIFVLVIFWTGFPEAFGVDHVDALRAALPRRRSGSSCAAPRSRSAARRRRSARRACSGRSSRSPRCWSRSSSAPRSGRSPRARCRRHRAAATRSTAGPTRPRSTSACSRSPPAPTSRPCSSPPTPSAPGSPDLVRAFRARALGAAVVAGALAIGGIFVVREDAPGALRRAHVGRSGWSR